MYWQPLSGIGRAKGIEMTQEEVIRSKKPYWKNTNAKDRLFTARQKLWDDGIIDPADTRKKNGYGNCASLNKPFPEQQFGVFRM